MIDLITTCTATGPLTPDGLPWPLDERWRTDTTVGLALGIREDAAFERMPILADALEEAGCDDELVLLHCRECPNHTPDCWVLRLLEHGDMRAASPLPSLPTWGDDEDIPPLNVSTIGSQEPDAVDVHIALYLLILFTVLGYVVWAFTR